MKPVELKIKLKSLSEEAKIIRKEENKNIQYGKDLMRSYPKKHPKVEEGQEPKKYSPSKKQLKTAAWAEKNEEAADDAAVDAYFKYWNLRNHRILQVRSAARATHLAYAFLDDKPYSYVEAHGSYDLPDFLRVEKMILEYTDEDPRVIAQRFAEWKHNALTYLGWTVVKGKYIRSVEGPKA